MLIPRRVGELETTSATLPVPLPGFACLAASRLETRRYSVIKGATAELTKEEGLTFDPELGRIYVALSDITASMGAQTGGPFGPGITSAA